MIVERPTVFVTQPVDDAAFGFLAEHASVRLGFGPEAERLADVIEKVDGLLVRTEPITAELIRRAFRLKVVCRVGIGLDNVDVQAATAAGIPVFNTAGANARTVAEMTFALALSVLRQIPRWDRTVREGGFATREQDPGSELHQKRWGIIGLGHIGTEVARTARYGFGMDVLAHHPSRPASWIADRGTEPASDLTDLLRRSDVVSVHVPLTEQTRDLIAAPQLAAMRGGAVLVNVSRGGVVNEAALVGALRSGTIRGAGIDVFDAEPPPPDHPLFGLDNVVLSPHRGGRTREATESQGRLATARLMEVLRGAGPAGAVNESDLGADQ